MTVTIDSLEVLVKAGQPSTVTVNGTINNATVILKIIAPNGTVSDAIDILKANMDTYLEKMHAFAEEKMVGLPVTKEGV